MEKWNVMTMGDCKSAVGKVVALVINSAKFTLASFVSEGWTTDVGGTTTAGSSICSSMIDSSHARNASGLSASG